MKAKKRSTRKAGKKAPAKRKTIRKKAGSRKGASILKKIIAKAKKMRKMPKNKNRKWTTLVKEAAKKR